MPRSALQRLGYQLVVASLVAGLSWAESRFSFQHPLLTVVWFHLGVAIVLMARTGFGLMPAVFCGSLIFASKAGLPPLPGILHAAGETLATTLGALLYRIQLDGSLDSTRKLVRFGCIGLVPASALYAATSVAAFAWQTHGHLARFPYLASVWFVAALTGALLGIFTIQTLRGAGREKHQLKWWQRLEFLLLMTGLSACLYTTYLNDPNLRIPAVLFVIWGALRFGGAGAMATVWTTILFAGYVTITGEGPLATQDIGRTALSLQLNILSNLAVGVTITLAGLQIRAQGLAIEALSRGSRDVENRES